MNARNTFTPSGAFDISFWFIELFGTIPSRYEYDIHIKEQYLDPEKFDIELIRPHINELIGIRDFSFTVLEEKSETKIKFNYYEDHIEFNEGGYLCFAADGMVVMLKRDNITVLYNPEQDELDCIKEFVKELHEVLPKEEQKKKSAKIGIVKCNNGDFYTEEYDINPTTVVIEENYNDDFKKVYDDTVEFLSSRSSGLVLYFGGCGTGKTNLIRHLCTNYPKEYIIIPNSVAQRLGDPDLISFVTDHTNSVFILEDCEQILEDRGENMFNNAISTILNMADGLLSDILNIKLICTFNAEISRIDPALLRKGRCIAKYEFKELAEDKVAFLNEKYNLNLPEIKPLTLAEIYNSDKANYKDEQKRSKIGF